MNDKVVLKDIESTKLKKVKQKRKKNYIGY